MTEPICIAAPLSRIESRLLRAYAERDETELSALADEGGAMKALIGRGFVQMHAKGALVTPEGLAAALT